MIDRGRASILALNVLLSGSPARGEPQPSLLFGDCVLANDPGTAAGKEALPPFVGCVRGKLGAEITTVSGAPEENSWARYGTLNTSAFFSEWVALHGQFRGRQVLPLGDDSVPFVEQRADNATVQIGNPALHPAWVNIGRMRLPFGLDLSEAPERYRLYEDRRFWRSPEQGVAVSFDNVENFHIDLGYAADRKQKDAEEPQPKIQAASFRLMADLSALDGSRIVASGYGENKGVRRVGLGFLTVSRKNDLTQFEFVRFQSTPDGRAEPFRQLLRLGYVGSWRANSRWVAQFDDQRLDFRAGTLGTDLLLFGHAIFRFAGSYRKFEDGTKRQRWTVTSGLEARL